jgi:hypothetical protein
VDAFEHGPFVLTCGSNPPYKIIAVNGQGRLLREVKVEEAYNLSTVCKLTGMVVLCSNTGTISRYSWENKTFHHFVTKRHEVQGFECTDICSGLFGEVFIVGLQAGEVPREVALYQVVDEHADDGGEGGLHRVKIESDIKSKNDPKCSVHGNYLMVGHDSKVTVLKLSK